MFSIIACKGYLPADKKMAIIYPGLKKLSLDPNDVASYLES